MLTIETFALAAILAGFLVVTVGLLVWGLRALGGHGHDAGAKTPRVRRLDSAEFRLHHRLVAMRLSCLDGVAFEVTIDAAVAHELGESLIKAAMQSAAVVQKKEESRHGELDRSAAT